MFDIVKQYILPLVYALVLILVYFIIAYRKEGILKVLITSILTIILSQAILFSLIAIVRFPVGKYLLTLILAVFVISISCLIVKFEKAKNSLKEEKRK